MSEGGGGSRSLAALDFVAAELHAAWEANLSTWGPDSERVELCLQAYNAAVLARVQAADISSACGDGAYGRQQLLVPGFRQHVESLVGLLQCPGYQDAFSFMAECVCFTSKAVVPATLRVLLCLGGLAGGAAAEAHGREVVDVLVTTVAQQFERSVHPIFPHPPPQPITCPAEPQRAAAAGQDLRCRKKAVASCANQWQFGSPEGGDRP